MQQAIFTFERGDLTSTPDVTFAREIEVREWSTLTFDQNASDHKQIIFKVPFGRDAYNDPDRPENFPKRSKSFPAGN